MTGPAHRSRPELASHRRAMRTRRRAQRQTEFACGARRLRERFLTVGMHLDCGHASGLRLLPSGRNNHDREGDVKTPDDAKWILRWHRPNSVVFGGNATGLLVSVDREHVDEGARLSRAIAAIAAPSSSWSTTQPSPCGPSSGSRDALGSGTIESLTAVSAPILAARDKPPAGFGFRAAPAVGYGSAPTIDRDVVGIA